MSVNLQECYIVMVTSDFQQICSLIVVPVSHHPDLELRVSPFPWFPQMSTPQILVESLHLVTRQLIIGY